MHARAGDRVADRYRLDRELGEGPLGRVWAATDLVLARAVAIKLVEPGDAPSADGHGGLAEQVAAHARTAARLSHPNIVAIHDVVQDGESPAIVMDYIDAPSLATRMLDGHRLRPREAAEIGACVLAALRYAHAHGVLHANLKPDDILLHPDRVVVTGFGLAGPTAQPEDEYVSPEQLRGWDLTPASDLWSLGAVLYEAVERNAPFRGGVAAAARRDTAKPRPATHAGDLAPLLDGLLVPDPVRRQDAAWAAARFAEVLGTGGGVYGPAGIPVAGTGEAAIAASPRALEPVRHSAHGTRAAQPPYPSAHEQAGQAGRGSKNVPDSMLDLLADRDDAPAAGRRRFITRRKLVLGGIGVAALGTGAGLLLTRGKSRQDVSAIPGGGPVVTMATAQNTLQPGSGVELLGESFGGSNSGTFTRDGSRFLAATDNGPILMWDLASRKLVTTLNVESSTSVLGLDVDPGNRVVAAANQDGTLVLWNLATKARVLTLNPQPADSEVNQIQPSFSPDGKLLASAYVDSTGGSTAAGIQLWDPVHGKLLGTLAEKYTGTASDVASNTAIFSPDGSLIAGGAGATLSDAPAGALQLWDVATRRSAGALGGPDNLQNAAFSADGKTLAGVNGDGLVTLWDLASRTSIVTLDYSAAKATSVAFSRDGKLLATGNNDGSATVWELATQQLTTVYLTDASWMNWVGFSADGKHLVAAGERVVLWTL